MEFQSLISGVSVCLPEDNSGNDSKYLRFSEDQLALPVLLGSANQAMEQANIEASDIDLIISISASVDNLAYEKEIYGPRICHSMQKELDASNAFAFDLSDASISTACDIANSMMNEMGLDHCLITRVDVNRSLSPDKSTGFSWSDGVAALVLKKTQTSSISLQSTIQCDQQPCQILLNKDIGNINDKKGSFAFEESEDFIQAYKSEEELLAQDLLSKGLLKENIYSESWFSSGDDNVSKLTGPYSFFEAVVESQKKANDQPSASIVFDPYRLTLSAHIFKINIASKI